MGEVDFLGDGGFDRGFYAVELALEKCLVVTIFDDLFVVHDFGFPTQVCLALLQ